MNDLISNITVEDANLLEEVSSITLHPILFGTDITLYDDFYGLVVTFLYVDEVEDYLEGCGFTVAEDFYVLCTVEVEVLVEHEP